MFASADGVLYSTFKWGSDPGTDDDVGRWHITPEGQFCRTWFLTHWDNRLERCYTVYCEGENFELAMKDRFDKAVYRRVPGNPEGY